jgi:predicted tellurium resistance membrane protein TerC
MLAFISNERVWQKRQNLVKQQHALYTLYTTRFTLSIDTVVTMKVLTASLPISE